MLSDADRRTLAAIEHRIEDEDPALSLLALRLSAEAQRRERQASACTPLARRPRLPRELLLIVVLTAAVMAAAVGFALGWWTVGFGGLLAIAVAARQFVQVVRRA